MFSTEIILNVAGTHKRWVQGVRHTEDTNPCNLPSFPPSILDAKLFLFADDLLLYPEDSQNESLPNREANTDIVGIQIYYFPHFNFVNRFLTFI